MSGTPYFGTRNHERFVPMYAPGADYSKVGWSSKSQYLNGVMLSCRSRLLSVRWPRV